MEMAPPPPRRSILGREAQLAEFETVTGLHGHTNSKAQRMLEPAPPLVIVYGGVSTGKSLTVHHAMREYARDFAMVDCTGVTTTRAFYREILGQLQSQRVSRRRADLVNGLANGVDPSESHELLTEEEEEITITGAPVEAPEDTATTGQEAKVEGDSEDDESSSSESEVIDPVDKEAKTPEAVALAAESVGSLNFLSFVKALRMFMASDAAAVTSSETTPRTVFLVLDHVEKLLDRGLDKLLTCLLAVNDQIEYLHVFDDYGAPWRLSVVLVARAVSLKLDLFLHGAHPAFVHFPAYTKDQVAAIVAQNLVDASYLDPFALMRDRLPWLRKWLAYVYDLLPRTHNDWLEFQHIVAQMLPSFHEFFDLVSRDEHAQLPQLVGLGPSSSIVNASGSPPEDAIEFDPAKPKSWMTLQKFSQERVSTLERSRRRHLFGYDNVAGPVAMPSQSNDKATAAEIDAALAPVTSGDPVAFIASSKLSRSCLLLLVASYLASFTPHEADAHFVSGSGGVRRKRRIKRISVESGGSNGTSNETNGPNSKKKDLSTAAARKAMNQQLVGPKIFQLPRLLAIYSSLQLESDAAAATNDREGESVNGNDPSAAPPPMWAAGAYRQDDQASRTRADIFTHLALLVRLRLLQRASPPSDLDEPLFRCVADTRLVDEIARRLHFPLDSYLNTRG